VAQQFLGPAPWLFTLPTNQSLLPLISPVSKMKSNLEERRFESTEEIRSKSLDVMKMLAQNDFDQCFRSWKSYWNHSITQKETTTKEMEVNRNFNKWWSLEMTNFRNFWLAPCISDSYCDQEYSYHIQLYWHCHWVRIYQIPCCCCCVKPCRIYNLNFDFHTIAYFLGKRLLHAGALSRKKNLHIP
jgi:hypothetical protein